MGFGKGVWQGEGEGRKRASPWGFIIIRVQERIEGKKNMQILEPLRRVTGKDNRLEAAEKRGKGRGGCSLTTSQFRGGKKKKEKGTRSGNIARCGEIGVRHRGGGGGEKKRGGPNAFEHFFATEEGKGKKGIA